MSFWSEYGLVVAFYVGLIALIYFNRHKFEWQGKIIAILRTNTGLEWMEQYGKKHQKLVRWLGSVGVVVGFAGMALIVGYLVYGVYTTFFVPGSPAVISPVLPGVAIPGTPIHVPLFEGLLALFVVILVHEAAHGLVGSAYGLKIKSSGLVLFGPLPGAFVEPDEKPLKKKPHWTQLSIFAAGPWSNVLLAGLAWIVMLGLAAGISPYTELGGVHLQNVQEGSPAALAGLPGNVTIIEADGAEIMQTPDFIAALQDKQPGDPVTLTTQQDTYDVTMGAYEDTEDACLGVNGISTAQGEGDIRNTRPVFSLIYGTIQSIIFWIFVLSLGLGLANLLPIGPIDGGRMIQLVFKDWFGKKGDMIWKQMSLFLFAVLLVLLFVPIIRDIVGPDTVLRCLPI